MDFRYNKLCKEVKKSSFYRKLFAYKTFEIQIFDLRCLSLNGILYFKERL